MCAASAPHLLPPQSAVVWVHQLMCRSYPLEKLSGAPPARVALILRPSLDALLACWRGSMRFLLCLAIVACSSPLKAQVVLNSYTGRYEIAPHNAVPQLNPFTGNFELASPGSVPKFNSFQGKWQMAPRNSVPRFNQYSEKWEMAPPDARLQINPYTGEWHYPR
jgi:hypothetical protein